MSGARCDALVNACRANAAQTAILGDLAELRYGEIDARARRRCAARSSRGRSRRTGACMGFESAPRHRRHPRHLVGRIADDGELQIRSPFLMKGYLDEPELTAADYRNGWFRSGDLGRVVDGESVQWMGRLKEVISRAGNKVTPAEIEQAICSHPDVAAAMAVGVADAVLGERIHLLLVPRAGVALAISALKKHLEPRLERYKQPDVYCLGDALPLGRTGKAD